MKPALTTALLLSLCTCPAVRAEGNHDDGHHHEEHVTKGPNGGQVVESKAGFAFEMTIDKERKARLLFLDGQLKPLPPGEQSVSGIAGERSAPVKVAFTKGSRQDTAFLISDKPLPAGDHVPMILVIRTGPDAKPVTERFTCTEPKPASPRCRLAAERGS